MLLQRACCLIHENCYLDLVWTLCEVVSLMALDLKFPCWERLLKVVVVESWLEQLCEITRASCSKIVLIRMCLRLLASCIQRSASSSVPAAAVSSASVSPVFCPFCSCPCRQ